MESKIIFNRIFSLKSSRRKIYNAIEQIIESYKDVLTFEDVNGAFNLICQEYRNCFMGDSNYHSCKRISKLFSYAHDNNKDLFIALILASKDKCKNRYKGIIWGIISCTALTKYTEISYAKLHSLTDDLDIECDNLIDHVFWPSFDNNLCPLPKSCMFCYLQKFHKYDCNNLPLFEDHKDMIAKYASTL